MYAIIESGGKQFRVKEGDILQVDRLNAQIGDKISVKSIFRSNGETVETKEGQVSAEIISQVKGKKIVVYKYKPKQNERKKRGHRQLYTKIKILSI